MSMNSYIIKAEQICLRLELSITVKVLWFRLQANIPVSSHPRVLNSVPNPPPPPHWCTGSAEAARIFVKQVDKLSQISNRESINSLVSSTTLIETRSYLNPLTVIKSLLRTSNTLVMFTNLLSCIQPIQLLCTAQRTSSPAAETDLAK